MKRYVIYSQELGVYLGNSMGLGFWSLLDPAGQDSAVTFETIDHAMDHHEEWESEIDDVDYREVECTGEYATIDECVEAGLPGWNQEVLSDQNQQTSELKVNAESSVALSDDDVKLLDVVWRRQDNGHPRSAWKSRHAIRKG